MNEIIAVKDYIVDKITTLAETVDLQEKVATCKKKLEGAKRDLQKAVKSLKEKKIGDCIACVVPAREEKKANPIATVFGVIGGVILVFVLMVILFYGIFCLLDTKKKNGYHTIKF
jgi:hypothetical protein